MTDTKDGASLEVQISDYDGAWKEALRWHLKEFIERCFPVLSTLIDWTVEPEWLDKEIGQIIGRAGRRNQEVDLLFKVRRIDGCEQWILCHLEIQSSDKVDFPFHIDLYNSGLKWLFQREVLTPVILADLKPDWRPSEYHFEFGGYGTDRRFPVCKVLDPLETDWAHERSIVVEVSRAQIAASDPESRFSAKTELVRNLYRAGYNQDEIRENFRLIDWMMHLRPDLERRFKSELRDYEMELQMPYITSIERLAKEEGLEEGREEGLRKGREEGLEEGRKANVTMLLKILRRHFVQLPEDIERDIQSLSFDRSQAMGQVVFDF